MDTGGNENIAPASPIFAVYYPDDIKNSPRVFYQSVKDATKFANSPESRSKGLLLLINSGFTKYLQEPASVDSVMHQKQRTSLNVEMPLLWLRNQIILLQPLILPSISPLSTQNL